MADRGRGVVVTSLDNKVDDSQRSAAAISSLFSS